MSLAPFYGPSAPAQVGGRAMRGVGQSTLDDDRLLCRVDRRWASSHRRARSAPEYWVVREDHPPSAHYQPPPPSLSQNSAEFPCLVPSDQVIRYCQVHEYPQLTYSPKFGAAALRLQCLKRLRNASCTITDNGWRDAATSGCAHPCNALRVILLHGPPTYCTSQGDRAESCVTEESCARAGSCRPHTRGSRCTGCRSASRPSQVPGCSRSAKSISVHAVPRFGRPVKGGVTTTAKL